MSSAARSLRPTRDYRKIPKYGELEGSLLLNNQQTKLALSRKLWGRHYPKEIADFGRQLDELGVIIMREVLREAGIPEAFWGRASVDTQLGEGFSGYEFRSL